MSTPGVPAPLPGARLLFSLDPKVVNLDHAGFGAVPIVAQRARQRILEEVDADPARFFGRGLRERLTHTRRHLCGFVGVDPSTTAFVSGVSIAVATVVRTLELRPGDEVVTTDHGDPAVAQAVALACVETGATHVVATVPLRADGPRVVAAVAAVLSPRTRLVVVDHVTKMTARIFPVADLVRVAHAHGSAVLVDAARVPGVLPTAEGRWDADFWVGCLDTWAFAPRHTALLSMTREWRERLRPLVVVDADHSGFPDGVESMGMGDCVSWLAAPSGLFTLQSLGYDAVRTHNRALAAYGQEIVGKAIGHDLARTADPTDSAQLPMRVMPLPEGVAATPELARALRLHLAMTLSTEVAVAAWRGRGVLRLSAQIYNNAEQFERLAERLPEVLRRLRGRARDTA